MKQKKGQFFIIAAVIISLIIVSLMSVGNYVRINKEPKNFYDLSYEVKHESGQVIDYSVNQGEDTTENLKNFLIKIGEDIYDIDPLIDINFIYGNESEIVFDYSYAREGPGGEVGGSTETSSVISIFAGGIKVNKDVTGAERAYREDMKVYRKLIELKEDDLVNVTIKGVEYTFTLRKDQQIITLLKKEIQNETYISLQ